MIPLQGVVIKGRTGPFLECQRRCTATAVQLVYPPEAAYLLRVYGTWGPRPCASGDWAPLYLPGGCWSRDLESTLGASICRA